MPASPASRRLPAAITTEILAATFAVTATAAEFTAKAFRWTARSAAESLALVAPDDWGGLSLPTLRQELEAGLRMKASWDAPQPDFQIEADAPGGRLFSHVGIEHTGGEVNVSAEQFDAHFRGFPGAMRYADPRGISYRWVSPSGFRCGAGLEPGAFFNVICSYYGAKP